MSKINDLDRDQWLLIQSKRVKFAQSYLKSLDIIHPCGFYDSERYPKSSQYRFMFSNM